MSEKRAPVYLVSGIASYQPPPIWQEATSGGDTSLGQYWETGKLEPIYSESLLWTAFERLINSAGVEKTDLTNVKTINVAISYPRELAQVTQDEVIENFSRRLFDSSHRALFKHVKAVRFTPTHAASASGMVPFN